MSLRSRHSLTALPLNLRGDEAVTFPSADSADPDVARKVHYGRSLVPTQVLGSGQNEQFTYIEEATCPTSTTA